VAKKIKKETIKLSKDVSVCKKGYKHLIECRCVLPQFKNRKDPPKHKFVVFSVIDENDNVEHKYAQCNNCALVHNVIDICTSDIQHSKESSSFILSIDDIKISLNKDLSIILEKYKVDLASWEQAAFILENKEWGNFIMLEQEDEGESKLGKYVRVLGENFFKIENFSRNEIIEAKD
jgi:hypothetical protein